MSTKGFPSANAKDSIYRVKSAISQECALSPRGIVKLTSLFRESQSPVKASFFLLNTTVLWQKENPNQWAGVLLVILLLSGHCFFANRNWSALGNDDGNDDCDCGGNCQTNSHCILILKCHCYNGRCNQQCNKVHNL